MCLLLILRIGMKRRTLTCETLFFWLGIAGIPVFAAASLAMRYGGFSLLGQIQPCMVKLLLGIPCPGCGGTHAVEYLLRGQIKQSILAHPLVMYAVLVYLYFMIQYMWKTFVQKRPFYLYQMPLRKTLIAGAIVLLLVQWVAKLF